MNIVSESFLSKSQLKYFVFIISMTFNSCVSPSSSVKSGAVWDEARAVKSLKCSILPVQSDEMMIQDVVPSIDKITHQEVLVVESSTRSNVSRFYQLDGSKFKNFSIDDMKISNAINDMDEVIKLRNDLRVQSVDHDAIKKLKKVLAKQNIKVNQDAEMFNLYFKDQHKLVSYIVGSALMGDESSLYYLKQDNSRWLQKSISLNDRNIIQTWWINFRGNISLMMLENMDDEAITSIYSVVNKQLKRIPFKGVFTEKRVLNDVVEFEGEQYFIVRDKSSDLAIEQWSVCY